MSKDDDSPDTTMRVIKCDGAELEKNMARARINSISAQLGRMADRLEEGMRMAGIPIRSSADRRKDSQLEAMRTFELTETGIAFLQAIFQKDRPIRDAWDLIQTAPDQECEDKAWKIFNERVAYLISRERGTSEGGQLDRSTSQTNLAPPDEL